ncbi:MAG: ribosome maturation factor RimP [Candidatus Omnitrophica bacterium]|nr:ribosome maturation factor RimP [Candidatus Omnitrophota bacterium]
MIPLFIFDKMEALAKIKELVDPIAEERGYFIIDTTYKREGGKMVLRVLLDKEGGITMDECADINNTLSEFLDKENIIEEGCIVEVSSPGLDRKLETDRDFVWAVGKRIKVTTYEPVTDKKVFIGTLLGLGEDNIVIDEEGVSAEIPREKIASAKLEVDWSHI